MTDWVEHLTVLHRLTGREHYAFSHGVSIMVWKMEDGSIGFIGKEDGRIIWTKPHYVNQWMNSHVGIYQLA